jgi:hypothetical protein
MTRLEQLLVFILDRAKKEGKSDLSQFQLFKIPYLLQVYSLKYSGTPFLADTVFIREQNGPISVNVYAALENLQKSGHVKKEVKENQQYGYAKHAFSLAGKMPPVSFDQAEIIFLDNFLPDLLKLTHKDLKKEAYETEPMKEIHAKEKGRHILKGVVLNFNSVAVDPDVVDSYADEF